MKRLWILLLAVGVVFALAVPVAAAPGDEAWCDSHPDSSKCVEDPAPEDPDSTWGTPCGVTTEVTDVSETVSQFTVDLGGRKTILSSGACIDVMSDAGPWTVSVEVHEGTLRGMSVFIRDSIAPGDGCFPGGSCGLSLRDIPTGNPFTLSEFMDDIDIPAAYVNACNVFEDDNYFGEWTVDEAGDPLDFYEGIHTDIPSPLAFIPAISGSQDVKVTLTVTFPKYTG